MEARFSAPVQTGPGAYPASCTMGTTSFPGVKSGRSVALTSYPLPVPWSRKSIAIPLLLLWAVRPVQSLSACTRVPFTFTIAVFVIAGFGSCVNEIFTLQGCYLRTFWDNLSGSTFKRQVGQIGCSETSVNIYQTTTRNVPEEWRCHSSVCLEGLRRSKIPATTADCPVEI